MESADRDRCYRSQHILHALIADNEHAYDQSMRLENEKKLLEKDIPQLEQQILVLQNSLKAHKEAYDVTVTDYRRVVGRWEANERKIPGLCIR